MLRAALALLMILACAAQAADPLPPPKAEEDDADARCKTLSEQRETINKARKLTLDPMSLARLDVELRRIDEERIRLSCAILQAPPATTPPATTPPVTPPPATPPA